MAILMTVLLSFSLDLCIVIWCFIIWSWTLSQMIQRIFLTELRTIRYIFAISDKHGRACMWTYNYLTYLKIFDKYRVDTVKKACVARKHVKIISKNILSDIIYHWINYMHIIWSRTSVFNPVSTHFVSKTSSRGCKAVRKKESDISNVHLHPAALSKSSSSSPFIFYPFLLGFASNSFVLHKDIGRRFATSSIAKTAKLRYIKNFFLLTPSLFFPVLSVLVIFWACTI